MGSLYRPKLRRMWRLAVAPGVTALLLGVLVGGCADKTITLRSPSRPRAAELATPLYVLPFTDQRGNEGDRGDPYRVGGVYGGYGNRLVKIMSTQPWPPLLQEALAAEFRAGGIAATATTLVPTDRRAPWLEGDVRSFSTEARWGREAHIAAIVRVKAPSGQMLAERRIEVRESGYGLNNFDETLLEQLMNAALDSFVKRVAQDATLRGALSAFYGGAATR